MNDWMNEWMNEWVNGWLIDWLIDWLNEWMNEWMNERMNEWMNEGMNEWMNQGINEPLKQCEWINGSTKFANFIFQNCSGTVSFYDLYVKPSSRYSLVRILPTSSSKSAPNTTVFLRLCEIKLSLQSRAHCANLIFQKCSKRDSFLTCSSANRALATTVLCTFCRQLLHIKARNRGNTDPTSATTEATLP